MIRQIAELIEPIDGLLAVDGDETVGAVLPRSLGSHQPILVYRKDKDYVGLVWPYKLLYANRPMLQSKIGKFAQAPPHLSGDEPIERAVEQMLALRLYTLPIYTGSSLEGMIRAQSILKQMAEDRHSNGWLKGVVVRKPVVSWSGATIRDVYSDLRKKKQSRVLTVDHEGRFEGVVSRRDIYLALLVPPKGKQRYSDKGGGGKSLTFDEDWMSKLDYPLGHLQTQRIVKLPERTDLRTILERILAEDSGCAVLVDGDDKPVGEVSIRSFLKAIAESAGGGLARVAVSDSHKILDAEKIVEIENTLERLADKISRQRAVERVETVFSGVKNVEGKVVSYEASLETHMNSGKPIVVKASGKNIPTVMRELKEKTEKLVGKQKK